MSRQGLMDDSGYHGLDECANYESCTNNFVAELLEPYAVESIEELISNVRAKSIEVFKEKSFDAISDILLNSALDLGNQLIVYAKIMSEMEELTDNICGDRYDANERTEKTLKKTKKLIGKAYKQGKVETINDFVEFYISAECPSENCERDEDFACIKCMAEIYKEKKQ